MHSKNYIVILAAIIFLVATFLTACGSSNDSTPNDIESPIVTAGIDPKTLEFDWSHISFPAQTDHYQLQIDPTGDSGFTTIEGADSIQDTFFTLTVPVHLTDWVNAVYRVTAMDAADNILFTTSEIDLLTTVAAEDVIGYFKAGNTVGGDAFGAAVALSGDGNTLAVGAGFASGNATDVNGDESKDDMYEGAGAVYVFTLNGNTWSQQAYIKAGNTDETDSFGAAVTLSDDGNTLAVGAYREESSATGVNGDESNNDMDEAGAVYVYTRSGDTWSQQAYIKASNTDEGDRFGNSVSLSGGGNTLAVGAYREDSNATGVNGDESNNDMGNNDRPGDAGAVYVFTRNGNTWSQQAYIKASNTGEDDDFGVAVSLSGDGNTLAVGARREASSATGINGDESNNDMPGAGAVYLY